MTSQNNDFFSQWMQVQKDMMDSWQKNMAPSHQANPWTNGAWLGDWWKQMTNAFMPGAFGFFAANPMDPLGSMKNALSWKEALYKLWKQLYENQVEPGEEAWQDLLDRYQKQSAVFWQAQFGEFFPKEMQETLTHAQALFTAASEAVTNLWGPWSKAFAPIQESMMRGIMQDPEAFLEAFDLWKKTYHETMGKYLNMPMMGISREAQEMQLQLLDRVITFMTYYMALMVRVSRVSETTIQHIFEAQSENLKKGQVPQSFEAFYDFWKKTLSDAFDDLFYSDEFTKLLTATVNAGMDMKVLSNKNMESYLKQWPIPLQSDMDSLYKKVHDLQKDLQALKKEVADLKNTGSQDIKGQ